MSNPRVQDELDLMPEQADRIDKVLESMMFELKEYGKTVGRFSNPELITDKKADFNKSFFVSK